MNTEAMVIGSFNNGSKVLSEYGNVRVLAIREHLRDKAILCQNIEDPSLIMFYECNGWNDMEGKLSLTHRASLPIGTHPISEAVYDWEEIKTLFGFGKGSELQVKWLQKRIDPKSTVVPLGSIITFPYHTSITKIIQVDGVVIAIRPLLEHSTTYYVVRDLLDSNKVYFLYTSYDCNYHVYKCHMYNANTAEFPYISVNELSHDLLHLGYQVVDGWDSI